MRVDPESGYGKMHEGRLSIESELGAGTRMIMRFPRERVEGFENVIALPGGKALGAD